MKRGIIALVGIVLLLGFVIASDVVELDETNFESKIASGDWLVEFYAPWCGHCKRLAPTWEEVATNLRGEVNVAKVDGSKYKGLATRFSVKGFPTIVLIQKGRVQNYHGERTAEEISTFATKPLPPNAQPLPAPVQSKPAPVEEAPIDPSKSQVVVLEIDNALQLLGNGSEWLVEFYAPWCGFCKKIANTWEKLAINLKEKGSPVKVAKFNAASSVNRPVTRAFNIDHFPQIFYIRSDGVREYTDPERTLEGFESFITKNYKHAQPSPMPYISVIDQYLGYIDSLLEPYSGWINDNIVMVVVGMITAGLLMGALIGKISLELLRARNGYYDPPLQQTAEKVKKGAQNKVAEVKEKVADAEEKLKSEAKKTK